MKFKKITENFNAHQNGEAEDDEGELGHARHALGLFPLKNFEDDDVNLESFQTKFSISQLFQPGNKTSFEFERGFQYLLIHYNSKSIIINKREI